MHRPQRPRRLWIRQSTFRSAYLSNIPQSVPSPSGEGADRGVARHAQTAKTASIMDSAKHFQVGASLKHPPIGSPLPPGEGADRGVTRHAPTAKTASIMDSVKHNQVGAPLKHPPISPLSLRERVRVRACEFRRAATLHIESRTAQPSLGLWDRAHSTVFDSPPAENSDCRRPRLSQANRAPHQSALPPPTPPRN